MAIVHVTDADFSNVIGQDELVLVDFWATWCGPCQRIAPMLQQLDADPGVAVKIAKLNVDENPQTTEAFGVMSIPTLKLFKNGQEVDTVVGLQPLEDLRSWVQQHA